MIRKAAFATAVVTFGLVVGGSAYAVSASQGADDPRPAVTTSVTPSADDNGGRLDRDQRSEPGDDRRVNGRGTATATPDPTPEATHSSRSAEPGDDNGGRLDRDNRYEPGDDRRMNGQGGSSAGDDRGRGSDDRGSDDRGGDDSGRGSDD
jgi:hypothetical protein